MFCVIMGDIIQSRLLDNTERRIATGKLNMILEQINMKYQANIMASFGIVRGDAFEGVILSQQDIPGIVQDIIKLCWEKGRIKLRICAVVGELSEIDSDRDKSDGPAFHKAVQEIERMRANKSDHWFQVSIITNTIAQPLIDSLLVLLGALTEGWTEKQTGTVWAMSDHSNQQKLVGQKMNVSLPTVSRHLKSANYAAYNKAWSGIADYLEAIEDAQTEKREDSKESNIFTSYYGVGLNKNKLNDYDTGVEYINESIELAEREFGAEDARLVPLYNTLAKSYLDMLSNDEIKNRILEGRDEIESISYSPDGKNLASGTKAGTIQIWDTRSGKRRLVLEGHTGTVNSVAFSPQEKYLASGSADGTVRIWDTETGMCSQVLDMHSGVIGCVAYSPYGRYLASGSHDNLVQIYDLKSGRRVEFKGHSKRVESIAFSPDGKNLASCSFDETVRIWNLKSEECSMVLKDNSNLLFSIAYSPDGRHIASGSVDKNVRIWDLESGDCIKTLKGHSMRVLCVAYSPDGKCLISGSSDKTLRIWDLENEDCCKLLKGHSGKISGVAYSPDGRYVASGSSDKTVLVWNLKSEDTDYILSKAKKAIDKALKCQKKESQMTIEYAQTMNLLGQYHLAAQQYGDALSCFRKSVEIVINIYGVRHPILQSYYNNIALTYKKKGYYEPSIMYYKKSLEIAKDNIEQDPLTYADSLYNIGLCYEEMGKNIGACHYIQESRKILLSYIPEKTIPLMREEEALERIKNKLKADAE